jgi:hypothetical protein
VKHLEEDGSQSDGTSGELESDKVQAHTSNDFDRVSWNLTRCKHIQPMTSG